MGLGLTISNLLLKQLGSKNDNLTFKTEKDEGTTFYFSILENINQKSPEKQEFEEDYPLKKTDIIDSEIIVSEKYDTISPLNISLLLTPSLKIKSKKKLLRFLIVDDIAFN